MDFPMNLNSNLQDRKQAYLQVPFVQYTAHIQIYRVLSFTIHNSEEIILANVIFNNFTACISKIQENNYRPTNRAL